MFKIIMAVHTNISGRKSGGSESVIGTFPTREGCKRWIVREAGARESFGPEGGSNEVFFNDIGCGIRETYRITAA